jgi:hypothetical protein
MGAAHHPSSQRPLHAAAMGTDDCRANRWKREGISITTTILITAWLPPPPALDDCAAQRWTLWWYGRRRYGRAVAALGVASGVACGRVASPPTTEAPPPLQRVGELAIEGGIELAIEGAGYQVVVVGDPSDRCLGCWDLAIYRARRRRRSFGLACTQRRCIGAGMSRGEKGYSNHVFSQKAPE